MEIRACKHGYGLFAALPYRKGAKLFAMQDGVPLPNPTKYSVEVGPACHIVHPFGSFLNHESTDPTVYVVRSTRFPEVRALRDIAKGEELTFNYNKNETHVAFPFVTSSGKAVRGSAFF